MKTFLNKFIDAFVSLFCILFIILCTNYYETTSFYFVGCLIFVCLFICCFAFFNSYKEIKQKVVKWLYFSTIISSSLYIILYSLKFVSLDTLAISKTYSTICMTFFALSIVLLVFSLYYTLKNLLNKNYSIQLFDLKNIKKLINLFAIVATITILTYPTNYVVYQNIEGTKILNIILQFDKVWIALSIVAFVHFIGYLITNIIESRLYKDN